MEQKVEHMERTFAMRCEDIYAVNWGIWYGDIVVFEVLDTGRPENGDIVMIRRGDRYELRKYYKQAGIIILESPNSRVSPLTLIEQEGDKLSIVKGIATQVIHNIRNGKNRTSD